MEFSPLPDVEGTPDRDRVLEVRIAHTVFSYGWEKFPTHQSNIETYRHRDAPLTWKSLRSGQPNKAIVAYVADMASWAAEMYATVEDTDPDDPMTFRDSHEWLTGLRVLSIRWAA